MKRQRVDQTISHPVAPLSGGCLLYTSDAADERSSVDLGGRRIIKKKNQKILEGTSTEARRITAPLGYDTYDNGRTTND